VARLSLIPQKREFFELYNRAAENIIAIAEKLRELLDSFPEGADDLVRDVKYRLAGALDDICDHVDEAAGRIVSYGVAEIREQARGQAQVICRAAVKLAEAVGGLEEFKESRRELIELRELEDEGDRLAHDGVSSLFSGDADPLTVIRWKDIHEGLEEAVDACENAADVLEAILVKNR
jgi:uncharacterized protein